MSALLEMQHTSTSLLLSSSSQQASSGLISTTLLACLSTKQLSVLVEMKDSSSEPQLQAFLSRLTRTLFSGQSVWINISQSLSAPADNNNSHYSVYPLLAMTQSAAMIDLIKHPFFSLSSATALSTTHRILRQTLSLLNKLQSSSTTVMTATTTYYYYMDELCKAIILLIQYWLPTITTATNSAATGSITQWHDKR